jgi:hypothetical protein
MKIAIKLISILLLVTVLNGCGKKGADIDEVANIKYPRFEGVSDEMAMNQDFEKKMQAGKPPLNKRKSRSSVMCCGQQQQQVQVQR